MANRISQQALEDAELDEAYDSGRAQGWAEAIAELRNVAAQQDEQLIKADWYRDAADHLDNTKPSDDNPLTLRRESARSEPLPSVDLDVWAGQKPF